MEGTGIDGEMINMKKNRTMKKNIGYSKRIEKAVGTFKEMNLIPTGEHIHAVIAHDDDCPIYENRDCRCQPEIILKSGHGNFSVGLRGEVKKLN